MILTILISIVVYGVIALVFVGMINWEGLGLGENDWLGLSKIASPLSAVAKAVKLPWLAAIVVVGAIIATAGSGGSWVLIQGRIPPPA